MTSRRTRTLNALKMHEKPLLLVKCSRTPRTKLQGLHWHYAINTAYLFYYKAGLVCNLISSLISTIYQSVNQDFSEERFERCLFIEIHILAKFGRKLHYIMTVLLFLACLISSALRLVHLNVRCETRGPDASRKQIQTGFDMKQ